MLTNCLAACAHLTITVSKKIVIFSYPPCIRRSRYGGSRRNIAIAFGVKKLEWLFYPIVKKISKMCLFVLTWSTNVTDRRTDWRTDTAWRHRPRLCIASRGNKMYQYKWIRLYFLASCFASIHMDGFIHDCSTCMRYVRVKAIAELRQTSRNSDFGRREKVMFMTSRWKLFHRLTLSNTIVLRSSHV